MEKHKFHEMKITNIGYSSKVLINNYTSQPIRNSESNYLDSCKIEFGHPIIDFLGYTYSAVDQYQGTVTKNAFIIKSFNCQLNSQDIISRIINILSML